ISGSKGYYFSFELRRQSRYERPIDSMKIPLLDLTRKYRQIEPELRARWDETLASMRLLNGPQLAAFEREFAEFCGVQHAIGVAAGTDAIFLSLRALGVGEGDGDEVILAAHAPAPVIEPIFSVGAKPVLVDKAAGDYGADLDSVRAAIGPRTRAILAVHMLGLPCDMDPLLRLAAEKNIPVVEDASQAQGAGYKGERAAGPRRLTPLRLRP